MITKKEIDDLTYAVIGCAIDVHKELGPGLLESVYETCLIEEFSIKRLKFYNQISVPILYKRKNLDCNLRLDLLVEDVIIVELKSIETILPIHQAQILTYMKLLKKPKGILINFNCNNIFKEGQKTFVNEFYNQLQ